MQVFRWLGTKVKLFYIEVLQATTEEEKLVSHAIIIIILATTTTISENANTKV